MDGAYWSIVIEIVFYGWVGADAGAGALPAPAADDPGDAGSRLRSSTRRSFSGDRCASLLATEYAGMFASGILIHRIRAGRAPRRCLPATGARGRRWADCMRSRAQRVIHRLYARHCRSSSSAVDCTRLIYAAFLAALWLSRLDPATPLVLTLGGLTYPLYLIHQNAGYRADRRAGATRWGAGVPQLLVVVARTCIRVYRASAASSRSAGGLANCGLARLEAAHSASKP